MMAWFMLPALVGLMCKICLLVRSKQYLWVGPSWRGFVAVLMLHNAVEALLMWSLLAGYSLGWLLRAYHFVSLVCVLYGANYVINAKAQIQPLLTASCYGAVALMGLLIFFTDTVVYGYRAFGDFMAADRGELFFLFRGMVMLLILLHFAFLLVNYVRAEKGSVARLDVVYTFIASFPMALLALSIAVFMKTGFALNPFMLVPIATTLFLMVSLWGKKRLWHAAQDNGWVYMMSKHELRTQMQHIVVCRSNLDVVMPQYKAPPAEVKSTLSPLMAIIQRGSSANDN